ncbi:MAG: Ig-like domain-containing protein [Chloroflexota bacterium]|nr:Ig-like domain-containing protein [Chloroflexota bacterium]
MNPGPALTHGFLGALVVALALVAGAGVAGAHPGHATDVDVRVWQHVDDPLRIHISARPEGTRWDALGTIPLLLDNGLSSTRNFRFGDITVEGVEVRVWQQISNPLRIDISARPVGGDWDVLGTIRLPLDDGFSSSGNYRYGDITVAVPAAPEAPAVAVSPGGEEVPRLAALTFAFADPPATTDEAALVSFAPAIEGAFVWLDSRTLLFQPDYPGWQRGQQYQAIVAAGPVGLVSDYIHTFRVEGQLEVASVIPGDGDTNVPTNAQILVQFNRSVAPLTVLQEGPAASVLEFDPPLEGAGEWLNTSLYRFIPTNLEPSATYSVRIPAGLTSAADGVLEADYKWSFSTIQPAVTSVTPHDEATFVEPDAPVVIEFNQPMDRASVEAGVTLRPVGGAAIPGAFEWNEDGTVATFTPDEPLELLKRYAITISGGLRSVSGGMTRSERTTHFTTVGPPELLYTYPEDGATGASAYGIELGYNNPMDAESFEERVSISGIDAEDIELRWYTWDAHTIRIHFDYEFSTEYTVRIAEGARDRGGRPVAAHEFSFTTRAPRPSLSLAAARFSTYSASSEQVLYYHAAQVEEVRFQLFRLSDSEAETLLRRGFIDSYRVAFWPAGEPLRGWTEAIDEELRDASRLYSTTLNGPEPLAKGHYFLAATSQEVGRTHKRVFSVVDTAIVTKLAFDELLVWALDYDTGKPLETASVRAGRIGEESPSEYQQGATDADGLARLATTAHGLGGYWSWYGEQLVRMDGDGREGVASTAWDFGARPWWDLEVPASAYRPGPVGHLFTERPIYRPGETVSYRGVVRLDDDAAYSVPGASATFSVRVRDPAYDEMSNTQVELNALGTFSGELVLPTDAPTGTYWLMVSGEGVHNVTAAYFTVAEFRVPEFEVEVASESGDYVSGDTIATEARAAFFFGGPVADAATEWAAQSIPTEITVEGYEDYSFSERTYWWWWDGSDERDPRRSHGEARTDSEGVARFEVPASLEADEGTQAFTISATVTDANAQAIAGSTTVTVHPATWYAGIKPESYIGRAEEPTTVDLVTVDYTGTVVANRPVTVRAFEREWIRTRERADHGGYRYRYELRETEVDTQRVTTGEDGEASIEFTPPRAGSYRLVAESTDDEGRVARSARYLWVSGSDVAPWPVRENDVIDLIAGRERYEVGDVAEVLVPAPFAGATGLVTVERGRVLSTEVRRFETNSEVLRIPIEDRHIPNIYVGVVLYRPPTDEDPYPRYHVGYVELSISTAPRRLDVSIEPDRERATPGETVRYEVHVTDSEGNGVEADVSVAVVDQAVLSLRAESARDGMTAFWFERALGVRTASSLAVSTNRQNEEFDEVLEGEKGQGDEETEEGAPEMGQTGSGDDMADMAVSEQAAEAAPVESFALLRVAEDGGEEPQVRSNFQNTALWIGQLVTDADGRASFELELPDNATTWRAQARAVTAETLVGQGESELLVTQPLLVRPALPRFLRVGDEVSLRTLVRNGTDEAREVTVTIAVEGVTLTGEVTQTRQVGAGDSVIFSWTARALAEGTATVRFTATATGGYGDAVELSLPVHLDVTPETTATGGVVEDTARIEAIFLPEYVITGHGSLELALQASLVGALDEELAHFWPPYRWESNVSIASRIVATIAVQRASASGLTEAQNRQLAKDIDRLLEAQMYDGGWAWCRSCYRTDLWVTGWVLIALGEARDAGYAVLGSDYRYDRTTRLITEHVLRPTDVMRPADVNQHAFLLYALTSAANEGGVVSPLAREQAGLLRSLVDEHRAQLTNWGRAYVLLGLLASGHETDHEAVRALLNDLTAATIASANGNHWEAERIAGCMHNSSVRVTALVLRALIEVNPRHALIEETARWLVLARSEQRWKSSVERAQGMASLGAFAELTGETRGVYDYQVLLNTRRVLDGHFDVPAGDYVDGVALGLNALPLGEVSRVQFEREADTEGRLYYSLNLRYVTPAREIEALNRGFAVSHQYTLLEDPETPITSASLGDVVRVTVTVVAPADRLFARVEDFLPAGLEPIDPKLAIVSPWLREELQQDQAAAVLRGGSSFYAPWYAWYFSPWDQVDLRDDRVTLLASRIPKGVHEYVYYARATTPGDFFVAPTFAEETYLPEVFGRSDSGRFVVRAE